jgi:hypothetical protein
MGDALARTPRHKARLAAPAVPAPEMLAQILRHIKSFGTQPLATDHCYVRSRVGVRSCQYGLFWNSRPESAGMAPSCPTSFSLRRSSRPGRPGEVVCLPMGRLELERAPSGGRQDCLLRCTLQSPSGNCQFCGSTAARAGICGPATFFVSRCSHSLAPSYGGPKGLRHTRRGLVALGQQLRGTTAPTHYARSQGEAAPFRTRSQASLQSRCKVHPIHRPCTTIRGTSLCWSAWQEVSGTLPNREA